MSINTFKKILNLNNPLQAELIDKVLNERNIPHMIHSNFDSAYDGLFQLQKGWGYVKAPEEYREVISTIYKDLFK